jgi:hypothetical protein
MQMAAYLWRHDPDLEEELARVADSMRQNGEALPADTPSYSARRAIWNVYYARLVNGTDRAAFLAALSPADHLATFEWLYPRSELSDDKQHVRLYMLGQLQEYAGDRTTALVTMQELSSLLVTMGLDGGKIVDGTRDAVRRLGPE